MYKFKREKQISFTDFNQPQGMQMNPNNRWVKKAEMIPWNTIEAEYAKLFPSHTGMPAKPLRMALGSLLIQKQYLYPDEELVEQIRENPYYQYFIGLPGYEDKIPFVPSLLVEFRKRLSEDVLNEINEMIIAYNAQKKCVIQEIFASLIMYNFSMLITENLSADDDKQNTYRYKTNYAAAIYACVKFYRSDHANPSVLEELIIRSKCPVRPDRVAKRKTRYHSAVSFIYRL